MLINKIDCRKCKHYKVNDYSFAAKDQLCTKIENTIATPRDSALFGSVDHNTIYPSAQLLRETPELCGTYAQWFESL